MVLRGGHAQSHLDYQVSNESPRPRQHRKRLCFAAATLRRLGVSEERIAAIERNG